MEPTRARLLVMAASLAILAGAATIPASAGFAQTPEPTDGPAVSADAPAADAPTAEPAASEDAPGRPRTALSRELAEQGEAELQKSVRVFQQRYLVKAGRAELLFGGGTSFRDPIVQHLSADVALLYHLTERWAFGLGGARWFGETTPAFTEIQNDFGLFPEKSFLQAGGFAELQFSPIFGKFASFGLAVLQVDAYLLAGGGIVRTTRSEEFKPAGQFGIGARVHTLRWLTVAAELRDMLFVEKFSTREEVLQQVSFGVRLGLWLPPTVQYRYQR